MKTEDSILKKIQKLLAIAKDKGATKAEAETAMSMAQKLMTAHNIQMAMVEDTPKSSIRNETFLKRKGAINHADKFIFWLLEEFYEVKMIYAVGFGTTDVIIVGKSEKIEIARYIHGYLRDIFFKCWNEYKKTVPNAHKKSYYRGLFRGIYNRMELARNAVKNSEDNSSVEKYEIAIANEKSAIDEYISNVFEEARKVKERDFKGSARDYQAGKDKGATVQINQAIKE